jgi:23S rRNA C2498 (ribose-2'-O)-methylase RlmM
MVKLIARLIKRYRMTADLFFSDAIAEGGVALSLCFMSQTLVEFARSFAIGDLVQIDGEFDDSLWKISDGRQGFAVLSISLISKFAGEAQFNWPELVALNLKRRPAFAIQVDCQFVTRVIEYLAFLKISATLSSSTLTYSNTRIVLIDEATENTEELLRKPSPLSQSLKRIYKLAHDSAAFAMHPDAVQAAALALEQLGDLQDKKFRISCFPKEFTQPLIVLLPHDRCCPKTFTHIMYVVYAHGLFYASVISADRSFTADIFTTACGQKTVSRAENKLEELVDRANLDFTSVQLALDVGAAPGGWSNYLAQQGVSRVIAVDNGQLRCSSPAIEHWKMLGQKAVEILISREEHIDLYVCDANIPPKVTVDIFQTAFPLMSKGGIFVLTLKNTCGGKEAFAGAVEQAKGRLQQLGIQSLVEVHLLANTSKETTVYGRI